MGLVLMSERELNRIKVLSRIDEGRLSVTSATALLGQQGGRIASVTAWAGLGAFWKGQAGARPRACTGAPVRKVPQHTSLRLQLVASGERCGIFTPRRSRHPTVSAVHFVSGIHKGGFDGCEVGKK